MTERTGIVTFKGSPMTLVGPEAKVGDTAKDATLTGAGLAAVAPLAAAKGKVKLLVFVTSLDTSVCSMEGKKFSDGTQSLGDDIVVYVISADLPFAQARWCQAENVKNLVLLSDYREMAMARDWGLYVRELGLFARAVYVVDKNDRIVYAEVLPEIAQEPDYAAAIAAATAA